MRLWLLRGIISYPGRAAPNPLYFFRIFASWIIIAIACGSALPLHAFSWKDDIRKASELSTHQPDLALHQLAALPDIVLATASLTYADQYVALHEIAKLEGKLGGWAQADITLQKCQQLCAAHKDRERVANTQLIRFKPLMKLAQFDQAKAMLDAAREHAVTSHDHSRDAFLLQYEGHFLNQTGHFEGAVAPLQQSLELFEKAKNKGLVAKVRIDLAWAYWRMGKIDEANSQYITGEKEALPSDKHLFLGHRGNIEFERRDLAKAAEYFQQAAAEAKNQDDEYFAQWLANEATTQIELREWKAAARYNGDAQEAARTLVSHNARDQVAVNKARIEAGTGFRTAALRHLTLFLNSAHEPESLLDARAEITRIYQSQGNYSRARASYQAALRLADRESSQFREMENKLSFQASVMKLNQDYLEGLVSQKRVDEAFATAEASRARMLRTSLKLPAGASGSVEEYKQRARQTNSAYLAYWVAPGHSYLWVITAAAFRCYPLPDQNKLTSDVDSFQNLVEHKKSSAAAGAALFKTLVQPAMAQLHGIDNVVIVPDGPLFGLNFETLRQGSPTAPYWIESMTVSITPSLNLMLDSGTTTAATPRVLLMGDALQWNQDFPRLPNAADELSAIEAQFPHSMVTRLSQQQATPDAYEREARLDYRYIHYATHATATRESPLDSAIILSWTGRRGTLTASDILRMPRLHAELVSISACHSAGARTFAGEGMVGLAWAFLGSGAHSVIAGLWDVSDHASPKVMGGLYSGLAHGVDASAALRTAKLELLQSGGIQAQPYYWGPFLLYRGAGNTGGRALVASR